MIASGYNIRSLQKNIFQLEAESTLLEMDHLTLRGRGRGGFEFILQAHLYQENSCTLPLPKINKKIYSADQNYAKPKLTGNALSRAWRRLRVFASHWSVVFFCFVCYVYPPRFLSWFNFDSINYSINVNKCPFECLLSISVSHCFMLGPYF